MTLRLVLRHSPGGRPHDQSTHNPNKGPGSYMGSAALLAQTKRAGGLTYNVISHDQPSTGFALSIYPERSKAVERLTRHHIERYQRDNADLLSKPDHHLGTWDDSAGGKTFLDVSVIKQDRGEAMRLAKQHDQIAVWDLGGGEEITVNPGATSGGQA